MNVVTKFKLNPLAIMVYFLESITTSAADDLASQRYLPKCPKCGAENEKIHNWNPIEGHCPKCGKKLHEVPGMIVMAD